MSDFTGIWDRGINWCKNNGYTITDLFMSYAEYGGGGSLTFRNTYVNDKVKTSSLYRNTVSNWVNQSKSNGTTSFYNGSLQFVLNDIPDLYYSIQHFTMSGSVDSDGILSIHIHDVYNFDEMRYTATLGALANDYGYILQNLGVLTPFNIDIYDTVYAGLAYPGHYIQYGSNEHYVGLIQDRLNSRGFNCGTIDEIFGDSTLAGVKRFQAAVHLNPDGVVGPDTWNAIFNQ